jgi:ribosomal protein L37AE/L43A
MKRPIIFSRKNPKPTVVARRDVCEFCGQTATVLPFGPKDEWICGKCSMKNKKVAKKKADAVDVVPLMIFDVTLIGHP